jgi:RecA/RadA recombinase
MNLQELKKDLEKKCKGVHVNILSESNITSNSTWIPLPSYDVNRIVSGSLYKGLPSKSFTVLAGPEAVGKSSIMCLFLAKAQANRYTPIVIDTEGSWTVDFCKRWSLNPESVLYIYSPWISDAQIALSRLIESEEQKFAIVIDSIGGLETKKLMDDAEKGDVKADMGQLQRNIKRMLKMLVNICKNQDSIGIAAGHYYGNSSGYGDAEQLGGGKYLKLAADIIISLKKTKLLDGKTVIGTEVKACTLKNRFYPPFNEAHMEIDYTKGVNPYSGLYDIGEKAGLFSLSGSWYESIFTDKKMRFSGIEELLKRDDVLYRLEDYIQTTGYSTINEEIAEAVRSSEEIIEPKIEEEVPVKKNLQEEEN